ncbi:HAD-IA family hydrolase [Deinococcus sp. HMF7604]|uniref:HAD-IA family hydrolase n=1 Tax=Deinococcus betulae TaxID=2873312 RepID=UPI001CCE45E0|nr:HAD-IA family hydrolase [Deinococcus betulae]MBZ9751233.1 HAD-IA family hydrolase [Deinococcus betulae]
MNPETHILLLDVDGVLVTPPEWFGARLLREHPQQTRDFFQTAFVSASTGQSDLKDHLPAFLKALGRDQTPGDFLAEWLASENHPNPDLLPLVRALRTRGWRTFLATNQEAWRTAHLLEVVGLGKVVDGHHASYAVGHRKPDPAYYAEVTRRLNVAPTQIVFWDDSQQNVQAAQAAGWQAHLYTSPADFQQVMGLG